MGYALLARGLKEPPQKFETTIDLSITDAGNLHVEMEFAKNQEAGTRAKEFCRCPKRKRRLSRLLR